MNNTLTKLIVFSLFCCISAQSVSESLSTSAKINIAGRQRMLTQSILKNYLSIGLDIRTTKSQTDLSKNIDLFENQLITLESVSPTSKIDRTLRKVRKLWISYKNLASDNINRENAISMIQSNKDILIACHDVVLAWEKYAATASAEMVNLSGRQRMLSQRIALYYFAHAWGLNSAEIEEEFRIATNEYGEGIFLLTQSPINTPEINASLRLVSAQWQLSTIGFDLLKQEKYVPHVIAVTTDGMLRQMENITSLYSQLDSRI